VTPNYSQMQFSHLHVHTQYSLLDGAANVSDLYKKAVKNNMPGLAITDHGNMFGAFKFVAEAGKYNTADNPNTIKPIVGCEFYLVENRFKQTFTKDDKDIRRHQLFLAKNAEGYKNLVKLCSLGYIEGLYSKYPRIDKELVLKYHKGLIATTCCLGASVPQTILKKGEAEGEQEFNWWLDIFGEDYYIEIQRHGIPEQNKVNEILLKWAVKYNVKVIASNDSHYTDRKDSNAHDILLCINTGEKQSTPKFSDDDDDSNRKGTRFGFYNDEFYFKTTEEMSELFKDVPQSIDNTNEIVSKVEMLKLKQDIMLPHYQIPAGFESQDEYLKHLTYEGAHKRYKEITPEVEERLNFELFTIRTMGFAGYFLIVQDFINHGKEIGVYVGPGRGSAAGSAVAYCIGITNIDPIKYSLLFERFLNPDRKSMPDIDTDFDDVGRQKVIDYVVQKYGQNQVAQIVTYGTMAAKMSIKDVARVLDLPLQDSNVLAKLVPDKPGTSLQRVINAPIDGEGGLKEKEGLQQEDIDNVKKLREIAEGDDLQAKVIKEALVLEGSVRGTGIHAAGIIIAPMDLTDILPVSKSKESDLYITQFEGKVIEDAGVIKMDFLGLKTLTILKDAVALIKQNHGVVIDLDNIPLDDQKTFELYQAGNTNGTFQFESPGMQKHLRDLKPDKFDDLIAMNALYRPGPLAYIPNYIARKHGREDVVFDFPEMKEQLEATYGITVYQEQVMLLSQHLAGFTKGDADVLRKAMGKKDKYTLDKMKNKFIEGATAKGLAPDKLAKVWTDWEAFAQYAFNKSHSTCYAVVAFQTAYLKAHYPGEYMSAVLNHAGSIDKVTFFMDECRSMGIPVLGPDVNESAILFNVNKQGQIRFGLGAVKGVGDVAAEAIIAERNIAGPFKTLFNLTSRVTLRAVNKRALESLAYAGGLDCFENAHRAQYFAVAPGEQNTLIEKSIRYGQSIQESKNSAQVNMFGEVEEVSFPEPVIQACEQWTNIEQLRFEKEVVGLYLSGHPLDTYRFEIDSFCNVNLKQLENLDVFANKELHFAGIMTQVQHRVAKNGNPFGSFQLEDYDGNFSVNLYKDDYGKMRHMMIEGAYVFVSAKCEFSEWRKSFELKISNIVYLSEVRKSKIKTIQLYIRINELSTSIVDSVFELIEKNKGNCDLKLVVLDEEMQGGVVEVLTKKFKVEPTNEFIHELRKIGGFVPKFGK
jgi:DNA polymerase III subunit alpha